MNCDQKLLVERHLSPHHRKSMEHHHVYIFSIFPFWSKMIKMIQNLWAHIWSFMSDVWLCMSGAGCTFCHCGRGSEMAYTFHLMTTFFLRPWVFYGFILRFFTIFTLIIYVLFLNFSYCLLFLNLDHSSSYCTLS